MAEPVPIFRVGHLSDCECNPCVYKRSVQKDGRMYTFDPEHGYAFMPNYGQFERDIHQIQTILKNRIGEQKMATDSDLLKHKGNYIELELELQEGTPLYLRVPALWDSVEKIWVAIIQTPKTGKLITACAKDSTELHKKFKDEMESIMEDSKNILEIYGMFKPLGYWE